MTRVVAVSLVCAMAAAPGASAGRARTLSVFASFESDGQPASQAVVPTAAQLSVSVAGKPATVESVSRVTARASILLLVDLTWTVTRGEHPAQAAAIAHLTSRLVPRMRLGLYSVSRPHSWHGQGASPLARARR